MNSMKPTSKTFQASTIYPLLWKELEQNGQAVLLTTLTDPLKKRILTSPSDIAQYPSPALCEDHGSPAFAEPFCKPERLIILGGGHVSVCLSEFAARVGFHLVVADDRESFASQQRFPWAVETLCGPYEQVIRDLKIRANDYVVLVTRGHKHDRECLRALWKEEKPRYIGMIGSRRRTGGLKDLLEEEGISRAWLDAIHTPIGLDIGAITPEEIAISILAELIQVKRMESVKSEEAISLIATDVDLRLMQALTTIPESKNRQSRAIVTIISTNGSSPRKAGAKMIVYEDGSTLGTIGGGSAEADMIALAGRIIHDGPRAAARENSWTICDVRMDADAAAEEGMVCGGSMKVLVELDLSCEDRCELV